MEMGTGLFFDKLTSVSEFCSAKLDDFVEASFLNLRYLCVF